MKMIKFPAISALAIGVVLVAATGVRAAEDHLVNLPHPMVVAGVDLRAGLYDIQLDLHGTRATVKFSRKGRVVATVQGVVSTLNKMATYNTLFVSRHPEGFIAINGLGFAGSDKDITFPVYPSHRDSPLSTQMEGWVVGQSLSTPPQSRPMISK